MPEAIAREVDVSFSDLESILNILKSCANELRQITDIPKSERKQIRDAVYQTTELLDSVLASIKFALNDAIESVELEQSNAYYVIRGLANAGNWEDKYHQFLLCQPLREASSELRDSLLGRFKRRFSFKDTSALENFLSNYLVSESATGDFVSKMLYDLSDLSEDIDTDPQWVMAKLREARDTIHNFRNEFIKLEISINDSL